MSQDNSSEARSEDVFSSFTDSMKAALSDVSEEDHDYTQTPYDIKCCKKWKIELRGKGHFQVKNYSWSSQSAWFIIEKSQGHGRDYGEFRIVGSYTQQSKRGRAAVHPTIKSDEKERLLEFAEEVWQNKMKGIKRDSDRKQSGTQLVGHRQDKCGKCQSLGHSCVGK
eukprot:TRINITY_DN2046_c0_g2_i1.p1 TRINITY_DN2046_c0_g2~~TRINITY_DN2046_c0_g2_i1.p1  ORF type:complete len:176 (-),score=36.17 TRINITY_DN2046_c0_g2_i1:87-587(-)